MFSVRRLSRKAGIGVLLVFAALMGSISPVAAATNHDHTTVTSTAISQVLGLSADTGVNPAIQTQSNTVSARTAHDGTVTITLPGANHGASYDNGLTTYEQGDNTSN